MSFFGEWMWNTLGSKLGHLLFPVPPCSYDLTLKGLRCVNMKLSTQSSKSTDVLMLRIVLPKQAGEVPDDQLRHAFGHLILSFSGNSGDLGIAASEDQAIADQTNQVVLAVEYPGYGLNRNGARPSPSGINAAAHGAVMYIQQRLQFPLERVYVKGYSLGSGPAMIIAHDFPTIAGLMLVAAYTSINDVASSKLMQNEGISPLGSWIVGSCLPSFWDNIWHAHSLPKGMHVLLVHGKDDEITHVSHAEHLCIALRQAGCNVAFYALEKEQHLITQQTLIDKIRSFISDSSCLPGRPAPAPQSGGGSAEPAPAPK